MTELERFARLFDQQVRHTWETVAALPAPAWTRVPVDSEANFLGTRVNRIHVASLLRHLCLTETYWFGAMPGLAPGDALPPPSGTSPLDEVAPGRALIERYETLHRQNLATVRAYDDALLARPFTFVGRRFTVGGFLWTVYGHHCYHLGQIDQLMRQQNAMPPEFLELPERERVIA